MASHLKLEQTDWRCIQGCRRKKAEGGFVLLAAGLCCIAAVAALGLAVDLDRVPITKNEAQRFADSAALDAVTELDGTTTCLDRAPTAVWREI